MTTFFVVGIVLNVALTGLALYWLWRQRKPRKGRDEMPGQDNAPKDLH